MSARHTDLPWKIVEDGYPVESYVIRYNNCSNQGYFVARFFVKDGAVNSPFDAKANAEFIIRAANNFDALLEACQWALSEMDRLEEFEKMCYFDTEKLRRVIQKASEHAETRT